MWRKFLFIGVPILILGLILLFVGADGYSKGMMVAGEILSVIGLLFVQPAMTIAALWADSHRRSGAPVGQPPVVLAAPASTKYCAKCGGANSQSAAFCRWCGGQL